MSSQARRKQNASNTGGTQRSAGGRFATSKVPRSRALKTTPPSVLRRATSSPQEAATLIGENAGLNLTTGEENVAIGCEALPRQQSVTGNIAIGFRAGWLNETGGGLVAIGYDAGEYQTSGEGNTYVGFTAGRYNVTSGANTAIGESALEGASGKSAGRNTAVGKEALNGCYANANTAIGYQAGASNKTGEGNIYIGCEAGNTATASNELIIANNPTTPLIAGTLSGTQKLGFYGVTPVARHATIAVPGGETTAELKAALKSVIEAIKAIGIIS
jgi:hypothetical protein